MLTNAKVRLSFYKMPESSLSYLEAAIYGCIQGLTEFLPVSSSGHLALAHQLELGQIPDDMMRSFSVCLHVATLLAVGIAFRKEIIRACQHINTIAMRNVVLSVLPAVVVGFSAASSMHYIENSMLLLGLSFLFTSICLIITDRILFKRGDEEYGLEQSDLEVPDTKQASWVGFAQALSLLPGISRSGSTLCFAILSGVSSERAFAYSFLVGIPLIAGAALHECVFADDLLVMMQQIGWGPIIVAMLFSLGSGILAISLLRFVIKRRCLSLFGAYCACLAGMCLVFVIME